MKKTTTYSLLCCAFLFVAISVSMAQRTISGKVIDAETKDALVGATVTLKGDARGTVTDVAGNYKIEVPLGGRTLIFSYVGATSKEVEIGSSNEIDVVLGGGLQLDNLVVIGTRSLTRVKTETAVPVDIIPLQNIANVNGQVDVNQLLQFIAPSFNSNRQSGADGADHVDPATLRGLGPDQTLVLINGKRQHQSSLVNIIGSRGRGNTGTDLNVIPVAAIERIEILRDGAAAQYGSDAIAGVINVVLKENQTGTTINATSGTNLSGYGNNQVYDPLTDTYKNVKALPNATDGATFGVNANQGIKIGERGFANITLDYLSKAHTFRPNNDNLYPGESIRDKFGDAALENVSLYLNSLIPLSEKTELYIFGGYSYRATDAYAFTRAATDLNRNVPGIYKNGFNPKIQTNIGDLTFSTGIRTKFGDWNADFNNTFGSNKFHYFGAETLNASLWTNSPTHFDDGGFGLTQNTTTIDFTRAYKNVLSGGNLAFGVENRIETYDIFAGEEGSYKDYVHFITVDSQKFYQSRGSQGFPGFRPQDVLSKSRNNFGAYLDAELDVTKKFLLTGALRFENYSDFGSTINGKISARYKITPDFFLRSSFSTGYRAPSLAQIYFQTRFTDISGSQLVDKVIANNESTIAKAAGIPKLKEETSENLSLGFAWKPANTDLTFTADAYYVNIHNRIVLSGLFDSISSPESIKTQLVNQGVLGAEFFSNAIDHTTTTGLDLAATYGTKIGNGKFTGILAANFNQMTIGAVNTSTILHGQEGNIFNARDSAFLVASAPKSKASLSLEYKIGNFSTNLRFTYFSEVDIINFRLYGDGGLADSLAAKGNKQRFLNAVTDKYLPAVTTDLSFSYDFNPNFRLTLGGSNIFDIYPTAHDPGWTESGGMYDAVQMGFSGAYYFAKLKMKF